jgi:hypothetical protein
MTYSVRYKTDGYHVNEVLVGPTVASVQKRFKHNRDIMKIVPEACRLVRSPDMEFAMIKRISAGVYEAVPSPY